MRDTFDYILDILRNRRDGHDGFTVFMADALVGLTLGAVILTALIVLMSM